MITSFELYKLLLTYFSLGVTLIESLRKLTVDKYS